MYFVYNNFLQLCEQILKTHSEVCFLCPLKSLWLLLLLFYWSQWELELTWCHDLWKYFLLRKKYQEISYATVDLPLWIPFTIPYSSCHAQWLCIEAPVIINRSRSWVQTLWHLHRSRGVLCSCSKSHMDIHMHIVPPTSPKQKPGLSTEQSREHLGCPALGEPFWGWDFDSICSIVSQLLCSDPSIVSPHYHHGKLGLPQNMNLVGPVFQWGLLDFSV